MDELSSLQVGRNTLTEVSGEQVDSMPPLSSTDTDKGLGFFSQVGDMRRLTNTARPIRPKPF